MSLTKVSAALRQFHSTRTIYARKFIAADIVAPLEPSVAVPGDASDVGGIGEGTLLAQDVGIGGWARVLIKLGERSEKLTTGLLCADTHPRGRVC